MVRRLDRLARDASTRWLFFALLAGAAAIPWLKTAGAFNTFRDAQVLWLYEDSARRSVLEFGQVPLWNPDFCGGLPALGTPQSRFASPPFLLTLLFGTTRAEPLTIFFMVLVAIFGAHRLARDHGASQLGATLAAPLFGLMGVFACAPFLGWFGFLGFALLPWVLLGVRRAARGNLGGVPIVAFSTAFIVGFGGTYVAPITLVACGVEVLVLLARRRRVAVGPLVLATLFALGLSAFRLWPVWEELNRGPRVIAGLSANDWQALGANLFGTAPLFSAEAWYFVSVPAAVTAVLALRRKRTWWLAGSFVIFLWLAAGTAVSPSLYALLRALPVFSLLRNAERFLVPAVLTLAMTVALLPLPAKRGEGRGEGPSRRHALVTLLTRLGLTGLLLAVPWQLHNFTLAAAKRSLSAPPLELQRPFHQARGNRWAAASFGPASRGSLACWEAYALPQSRALRADLENEAFLAEASAGRLIETRWSPNHLAFHATLERPTKLVVNQNYHRGWKSDVGTVVAHEGLLAVELPAGEHEVSLRFLPTSAIGGLSVSALALVLLLAWRRKPTSPRASALTAGAPLLLGLLIAATSTEPPHPTTQPVGPEGEALIADAPPPDAKPLKVRFAAEVVLEAASLTWRPEDDRVRIELDWSRGGSANQKLGVFVHIEPGELKRITADHLQVSDGLFLEQVPPGKLGRDIMLIDVPHAKRAPPWNVWVGLWEMRGDGHRVPISDANGARVEDGRVLIGTVSVAGPQGVDQRP